MIDKATMKLPKNWTKISSYVPVERRSLRDACGEIMSARPVKPK
jgi:hypothetical protein